VGRGGEVHRTLKPGALFAGSDWCLTDRYRQGDAEHTRIKQDLEKGNGISQLVASAEIDRALRDSGFEILESCDLRIGSDIGWWAPLAAGVSLHGLRNSRAGAVFTHHLVQVLESLRLSPPGTVQTHDVLRLAHRALVEGGETGLLNPMYFWVARRLH
jgi:sterol 24-C-methyltransferase